MSKEESMEITNGYYEEIDSRQSKLDELLLIRRIIT